MAKETVYNIRILKEIKKQNRVKEVCAKTELWIAYVQYFRLKEKYGVNKFIALLFMATECCLWETEPETSEQAASS